MHQYTNEDLGWLRLKDMQRESENRRLIAGERHSAMLHSVRRLIARTARKRRPRAAGA